MPLTNFPNSGIGMVFQAFVKTENVTLFSLMFLSSYSLALVNQMLMEPGEHMTAKLGGDIVLRDARLVHEVLRRSQRPVDLRDFPHYPVVSRDREPGVIHI